MQKNVGKCNKKLCFFEFISGGIMNGQNAGVEKVHWLAWSNVSLKVWKARVLGFRKMLFCLMPPVKCRIVESRACFNGQVHVGSKHHLRYFSWTVKLRGENWRKSYTILMPHNFLTSRRMELFPPFQSQIKCLSFSAFKVHFVLKWKVSKFFY